MYYTHGDHWSTIFHSMFLTILRTYPQSHGICDILCTSIHKRNHDTIQTDVRNTELETLTINRLPFKVFHMNDLWNFDRDVTPKYTWIDSTSHWFCDVSQDFLSWLRIELVNIEFYDDICLILWHSPILHRFVMDQRCRSVTVTHKFIWFLYVSDFNFHRWSTRDLRIWFM